MPHEKPEENFKPRQNLKSNEEVLYNFYRNIQNAVQRGDEKKATELQKKFEEFRIETGFVDAGNPIEMKFAADINMIVANMNKTLLTRKPKN